MTVPAQIAPAAFSKFGLYHSLIIVTGPGPSLWEYAPHLGVHISSDLQSTRYLIAVGDDSVTLADDG